MSKALKHIVSQPCESQVPVLLACAAFEAGEVLICPGIDTKSPSTCARCDLQVKKLLIDY